jgi:hypothetical protein
VADQEKGLDASISAVPDLGQQRAAQAAILAATVADWAAPGAGEQTFGAIDRAGWSATIQYLGTLGMVPKPVTLEQVLAAPSPAGT